MPFEPVRSCSSYGRFARKYDLKSSFAQSNRRRHAGDELPFNKAIICVRLPVDLLL